MSIGVLVVDDSGFFRQQVKTIINADPRLRVVGEASNGREAVEKTLGGFNSSFSGGFDRLRYV